MVQMLTAWNTARPPAATNTPTLALADALVALGGCVPVRQRHRHKICTYTAFWKQTVRTS